MSEDPSDCIECFEEFSAELDVVKGIAELHTEKKAGHSS
jgi:hypothetical protein